MLHRKIPMLLALPMLGAIGISLAKISYGAAQVPTAAPAKAWSNEECLSCHTNKRILREMQSKRGDSSYCEEAYKRLTGHSSTSEKGDVEPTYTN